MSEYVVTDTELTAVADAIRTKGGTSANLEWYSDFVDAISAISGGGSTNILSGADAPTASVGSDGAIYLQTTPAGIKNTSGQYIDTGYSGNDDSKYVIDFRFDKNQSSLWVAPFGGRPNPSAASNASIFTLAKDTNNYTESAIHWGSATELTGWPGANELKGKYVHLELSAGLAKMAVDGVPLTNKTWTPLSITETTHIGLFAALANNQYQSWSPMDEMVLYRFKIYENNVLVHDFEPAVDTNNVVCLKDNVTGDYKYVNSGTLTSIAESDDIQIAYLKVNGAWQALIGSDIDDVDTGSES